MCLPPKAGYQGVVEATVDVAVVLTGREEGQCAPGAGPGVTPGRGVLGLCAGQAGVSEANMVVSLFVPEVDSSLSTPGGLLKGRRGRV